MTPTPDEAFVAGVIEKLSEPLREALIEAKCDLPKNSAEWSADCICGRRAAALKLIEAGLAEKRLRFPNGIVRTPKGLAVRHQLLRMESGS